MSAAVASPPTQAVSGTGSAPVDNFGWQPVDEQAVYYYPELTATASGQTSASRQLAQAVNTLSKLVEEGELHVSIFTVHFASRPQALHAAIEKRSILRLVGKQTVEEVDAVQPAPPTLLSTRKPCVYKRYIKLPVDQPVSSCIAPGNDGGYIGRSIDGGGREHEHLRATPGGTSLHYLAAKIAELLASHPLVVVDDDLADLAAELAAAFPSLATLGLLKTPRHWLEAFLKVAEAVYTILDRTCQADVLYNDAVTRHSGPPPSNSSR